MYVVEIFLPLRDNDGQAFARTLFAHEQAALTERFGGLTAYSRAPAQGVWQDGDERVRDDILILEVMADKIDRDWWRVYRRHLETTFRQDEILIRASEVTRL